MMLMLPIEAAIQKKEGKEMERSEEVKEMNESLANQIDFLELNRENFIEFDRKLQREGIRVRRRIRYLQVFRLMNKVLKKDVNEIFQGDMDAFFEYLNNHDYAEETRRCTWIMFRRIMRDFNKELRFDEYKSFLVKKYKYPREILKKEEVQQMIRACKTARERLVVSLLFNSGFRPDEFLHLRKKDITIDADGIICRVDGKTGERIIRLLSIIDCKMELIEHIKPLREDDRLFNFGPKYLSDILRGVKWEAGIQKRVTPYTFRHSCASFAAQHLTDNQMCPYFGWIAGSEMSRIYVHLSARDIGPRIIDVNCALREREFVQKQREPTLDVMYG